MTDNENTGRYVYCVAQVGEKLSLGNIGLDGSEVYTLPARDLCAVVSNCPTSPYASDDEKAVHQWVISHQGVVEAALKEFGTVLPMRFDTIIRDTDGVSAIDNVRQWLSEDSDVFRQKLEYVRGKEEYGVQLFCDFRIIAGKISETSPEISKLEEDIRSKPKGMAYMYRQRLEKLLKQEVERVTEMRSREFHRRIKACVSEVKLERTKKKGDKQMMMNLSCLVPREGIRPLADELEEIDRMEGFSVRFTGPWPPYSFVTWE